MSKRNAQDSLNAAQLMWDRLRDPNREPQAAPESVDPHAVLRRRNGRTVRVTPRVVRQDLHQREANRVRRELRRGRRAA